MLLTGGMEHRPWLPLIPFSVIAVILILFTWQQDVYEWYAFEGEVLLSGRNPYLPLNEFVIEKYGQTGRYGYPPLALPFFASAAWLVTLTDLPFHLFLGIESLIVLVLGAWGLLRFVGRPQLVYLWLFNPFILVVALGWKFLPDLLMVTFFLLAIVHARHPRLSGIFLGLAALSKQIVWIFIPLFLWGLYVMFLARHTQQSARSKVLVCAGVTIATFTAGILPFGYPYSPEAISSLYHGLLDPAEGLGNFSFYTPFVSSGLFPGIAATVMSLLLIGGWMSYAGWIYRRLPMPKKDGGLGKESLLRFLVWSSIPIPILSMRLGEPHFWLLHVGILALVLSRVSETERPAVGLLYLIISGVTYLFFTAQMGFRHLAFHLSPWPTYAYFTVLGMNWWQWLWVIGSVSLAAVVWAYLRAFRYERLPLWPRTSEAAKAASSGSSRGVLRTHGRVLLLSVLFAAVLSGSEVIVWLVAL